MVAPRPKRRSRPHESHVYRSGHAGEDGGPSPGGRYVAARRSRASRSWDRIYDTVWGSNTKRKHCWRKVRGPIGRIIATLAPEGWDLSAGPWGWTAQDGQRWSCDYASLMSGAFSWAPLRRAVSASIEATNKISSPLAACTPLALHVLYTSLTFGLMEGP